MEKGAQNRKYSCLLWAPFNEKCLSALKFVIKHQFFFFCTFHIDKTPTQETSHPCTTATCDSHPTVFSSICTTRIVLSAQELLAIEKKPTAGMGNQKIATTKEWLCRSKTQRKNTSFYTSFDTPWQSPDTDNTCLPEMAPPYPQKGRAAPF